MLSVVNAEQPSVAAQEAGRSPLDDIVRDGARPMLAAALKAEVAAHLKASVAEVDEYGHRLSFG